MIDSYSLTYSTRVKNKHHHTQPINITRPDFDTSRQVFLSKHELYFVKENYEIFSTEVSAREKHGQNSGGPHQGVIGSLGISSVVQPF